MGLGKKTIDDQNYCGKKVLVRCDFNVPMKDGVITNENRINAALPTIQKLVNDGAKVILCSHLGKPKNGPEAKFSLAPVAVALSAKLGKTVVFADDDNVVGENAKAAVAAMNNGDVVLLQNTRFRKEETKNMPEFSQELASLADAYVDDAFGSSPPCTLLHRRCHRLHQGYRCRLPDGEGDQVPGQRRQRSRPSLHRHPGRRKGRRQAERHLQPAGEGRYPDHRRRHGLHLRQGSGLRGRQEPVRRYQAGLLQGNDGQGHRRRA